ncbi:MAG: caspase family protein, partial [Treponema sp.]|nr:caspase family protein [Treponema sp.]
AAVLNPVANVLASIGINEKQIRIWDAESAREIKTIPVSAALLTSLAWNKDGTLLACGSWAGEIEIFDYKSGAEVRRWKAHGGSVNSLCVSPDGSALLSASFDGAVKIWDMESGGELAAFSGFGCAVNSAVYTGGGASFLAACSDGTVRRYGISEGAETLRIAAHKGPVYSALSGPDGGTGSGPKGFVVSAGFDGLIRIWDSGGSLLQSIDAHQGPVMALAFSPDYSRMASGSMDKTVIEWSLPEGKRLNEFTGHQRTITAVAYKDKSRILSASIDQSIREWDVHTGEEALAFTGYSRGVHTVMYSGNEDFIISGHGNSVSGADSVIRMWDARTGALLHTLEGHKKYIRSLDISPDGGKIASGSADATVKIWDALNHELLFTLEHATEVSSVAFNPQKPVLASGSLDGAVNLWDTETGALLSEYQTGKGRVTDITWKAGGNELAAATDMGKVYLWDTADPSNPAIIDDPGRVIAYSPDGRRLVSGSYYITVRDAETREPLFTLSDHETSVNDITFSRDGKYIVSASGDQFAAQSAYAIKIWDAESGALLTSIEGHNDVYAASLALSGDAKRMVTASVDTAIRIWDLNLDGKGGKPEISESLRMLGFENGEWISVTPEGYFIASPNGGAYLNVKIGDRVYGLNQYRDIFRRPEIVAARLEGKNIAGMGASGDINTGDIEPPAVEILSEETNEAGDSVTLVVSVTDEKRGIKRIEFFVNDSLLGSDALRVFGGSGNLVLEEAGLSVTNNARRIVFQVPVPLTREFNRIKIVARNDSSAFGEKTTEVMGKSRTGLPNLWILAIGINTYPYERQKKIHSLNYAVQDAHAFVEAFKAQEGEGKAYNRVNYRIISDDSGILPTRENILNNLGYLKNRGSNDIVMLFFAGHGLNDEYNKFYFIPRDFFQNDDGSISFEEAAISSDKIKDVLWAARGRKMIFVDACHSGNIEGTNVTVDNSQLSSNLINESIIIMTASKGAEASWELPLKKHGIFTFNFIEGMRGKADVYDERKVSVMTLYKYIEINVKKSTKEKQHPEIIFPTGHRNDDYIMANLE